MATKTVHTQKVPADTTANLDVNEKNVNVVTTFSVKPKDAAKPAAKPASQPATKGHTPFVEPDFHHNDFDKPDSPSFDVTEDVATPVYKATTTKADHVSDHDALLAALFILRNNLAGDHPTARDNIDLLFDALGADGVGVSDVFKGITDRKAKMIERLAAAERESGEV